MQVLRKQGRRNVLVKTIGCSVDRARIEQMILDAQEYIAEQVGQAALDLRMQGPDWFDAIFQRIESVRLLGPELVLGKLFDAIGFDQIPDRLFRHLVLTRLVYPGSKLKTMRYLAEFQGAHYNIDGIYRYLDKLHSTQKERVQRISLAHTLRLLGGTISVVFYDVTTLYFEAEQEDELRIAGFSKDGKNNHPQILLGLLVSAGGYPLAYDIFEGNTFEGHTMLGVLAGFQKKYALEKLVVVADAGLLSRKNIADLVAAGHQYILGARLRALKGPVKEEVLALGLAPGHSKTLRMEDDTRLIVSSSAARAKKDAHNRTRALERLQKSISQGKLTKAHINNRGYNRFLKMAGEVAISIDHEKLRQDQRWDGLKGYVTNTDLPSEDLIARYKELWRIEKAFRISKTDLRIRPIYHRRQRRIEAHLCICFAAYKIYKELERLLQIRKSRITIERAIECTRTIYGITIKHPTTGRSKTKLFTSHDHQLHLLEILQIDLG